MSGYTNAVTNITDESQYYVYPMAASLRGGAVESEYNIRNLMTCLFNKSAAKQDEDFILYYNKVVEGQRHTLETYYDNTNWYSIDLENGYCTIKDIAVGPGEGNCNGYYTRLQDFTPINNTALNIQNLMGSHSGYTPVLPADLAPSLPIAKCIFDSLDTLISAETTGLIGTETYKEETTEGTLADYVVDGRYIPGTTVRIKLEPESSVYVYYVKDNNNNWQLTSDIVAVYENTDDGQSISIYRVYTNGKYFYKNAAGDIEILSFKDSSGKNRDNLKYDTTNKADYLELPGDIQLYKINVGYQKFNVILGLNWTVNQLVSSAQITICEDTTPIKYITETDIEGDTTQYAYTEYGILNKTLRDRGLLDAGILLGTIKVKKTPVHSIINDKAEYNYEYTCTYEGNRYKTACIDLARLGTDTDTLGENMYDKINRLFSLMIDSGSFKIGSVIRNSGFDPNPDSANHDFVKGIAPYRLDLGISDFESGVGQDYVNGYLRFINYDENTNSAEEEPTGYVFKCRVKVDAGTGLTSGIESMTLFNDAIYCSNNLINFNSNVDLAEKDENGHIIGNKNLYVTGTTISEGLITANYGVNIAANKALSFGNFTSTLSADGNGLKTDRFVISSSLKTSTLQVPTGTSVTLDVANNKFVVNTDKLKLNSTNGTIITSGKIETSNNIEATTGTITGNKVYGAVWM